MLFTLTCKMLWEWKFEPFLSGIGGLFLYLLWLTVAFVVFRFRIKIARFSLDNKLPVVEIVGLVF